MLITQHRIYRIDLRNNPDVLYVFGDNVERVGLGGQAGEMRGEPNAIGVATKWTPAMNDRAFFTDAEYEMTKSIIAHDMKPLLDAAMLQKPIVFPADGIGTGLSEMPSRCPKLYQYIRKSIEMLKSYY